MIKPGVDVRGIQPEILLARIIAGEIFARYGVEAIITSVREGTHKKGSKHYTGQGIDFRTRHMDVRLRPVIAEAIKKALGRRYFVLLEKDHIHVQFGRKE